MSKKKALLLNAYWQALFDLNEFYGRNITAGEFGQEMEMSRNTAKKYLEELIKNHGAGRTYEQGKNHQPMAMYYAICSDAE